MVINTYFKFDGLGELIESVPGKGSHGGGKLSKRHAEEIYRHARKQILGTFKRIYLVFIDF